MRTDTARLTEEELVQVEEAVGAWVLENGAYDYDRENLSYTIIATFIPERFWALNDMERKIQLYI